MTQPVYLTLLLAMTAALAPAAGGCMLTAEDWLDGKKGSHNPAGFTVKG